MKKKLFSILLSLAMVISMMPAMTVFAESTTASDTRSQHNYYFKCANKNIYSNESCQPSTLVWDATTTSARIWLMPGDTLTFVPEDTGTDRYVGGYTKYNGQDGDDYVGSISGVLSCDTQSYGTGKKSGSCISKIKITANKPVYLQFGGGGWFASNDSSEVNYYSSKFLFYVARIDSLPITYSYGTSDGSTTINASDLHYYGNSDLPTEIAFADAASERDQFVFDGMGKTIDMPSPVVEGYKFNCWAASGDTRYDYRPFYPGLVQKDFGKYELSWGVSDGTSQGTATKLQIKGIFSPEHTIKLDANGGKIDGYDSKIVEFYKTGASTYSIELEDTIPTYTGKTFQGWYPSKSFSEDDLVDDSYQLNNNWNYWFGNDNNKGTLYAKWDDSQPDPGVTEYTLEVENGTSAQSKYKAGDDVVVTANDPAEGMEFDKWTVTSGTLDISSQEKNTTMTFKMPSCNLSLKANYKESGSDDPDPDGNTYTLWLNMGHSDKYQYKSGETVVVTASEPEEGMEFDRWTVQSGTLDISSQEKNKTMTFKMPNCDLSLKANYKEIGSEDQYYITVQSDGNGSAWADAIKAKEGTVVNLTTEPNEGYKFKEWQVISGDVSIVNNKFTVGKSDVKIKAFFEARQEEEKTDISKATITINAQKYTGKELKPKAEVVVDGVQLEADRDYTITYSNNTNVGKATATVKGIGDYEGTAKGSFKINPKGTSISKLSAAKKAFTAKWKSQKTQTTGYQVRYSLKSDMSGAKTQTISSNKTTSKKVTSLKAKKKYYVQVRTYKTVKGVKYYSSWSTKKSVTTKK